MAEPRARVPGAEARAGKFPGPSLIPALNAIQERVGWLPREELVTLSHEVHRPLYEIEGLISFYPHFRTEPPKKAELRVCHDLTCWLRGADAKIDALRERYGDDADVGVEVAAELVEHVLHRVGERRAALDRFRDGAPRERADHVFAGARRGGGDAAGRVVAGARDAAATSRSRSASP